MNVKHTELPVAKLIEQRSHDIVQPKFYKDRINAALDCTNTVLALIGGR